MRENLPIKREMLQTYVSRFFLLLLVVIVGPVFAKRPLTEKQEELVKSLAVPLQEDMTYYRWQSAKYAKTLVQEGTVTPKVARRLSQNPDLDYGTGLYLARTTWDSSQYGQEGSRLVEVHVKKGTLTLTPEAVEKLKDKGIDFTERKTKQSVVLTYKHGQHDQSEHWYVAMNMNSTNVQIVDYPTRKLSFAEVEKTAPKMEGEARNAYIEQVRSHVDIPKEFTNKPWLSNVTTTLYQTQHGDAKFAELFVNSIRDSNSAKEAIEALKNNDSLYSMFYTNKGHEELAPKLASFGEPQSFNDRMALYERQFYHGNDADVWLKSADMSKEELQIFAKKLHSFSKESDFKLVAEQAKRLFNNDPNGFHNFMKSANLDPLIENLGRQSHNAQTLEEIKKLMTQMKYKPTVSQKQKASAACALQRLDVFSRMNSL